ncbi:hypothetical protein P171DRAFT_437721 [Karstenula rhodostoma CBS 690.94]|uniref:Uncharacterized protein n=1 Tax=Karstenula rhodostoma CBS 690.94 TaxID=1392251 RepID=A0A9P4P5G3_9PLEO|nr:hypothetical protein P171DRAFT_437721 [Karstenula rhodostoma CBS 690.94]
MAYTSLLSQIPALTYSSDPAALSSCRLTIKYSAALKQAALFLRISLHIHGFDDVQSLSLMYQADNLSSIFVQPATEILSPDQRKEIARHITPAAKTLHLNLHRPCLIQCPPSARNLAPKTGHENAFHHLQELTRATVASVIFDANYIHEQHYAAFFRLTTRPDQLAGLSADEPHASRHKDWTVFVPAEIIHRAIAEEGGSDAPPLYTEAPAKRAASPSTPSPPHKHRRKPNPLRPSPATYTPPSPTEKATSTTASPKQQLSSPAPLHSPGIQHLVANAIESLLPQALEKARETEKNMVEEQLPEALQKILPGVLARLFVVASSSLTPQPHIKPDLKDDPAVDAEADADADTDIKDLIATRIRQIAQKELEEMHVEASRDAVHELEEAADDLKADLNETKNEGITELQNASERSLKTFQDIAAEVVKQMAETLEGHADDVYTAVWDDISDLVAIKGTMSEKMKRRILVRARQVFEKERVRRKRLGTACMQDKGEKERGQADL